MAQQAGEAYLDWLEREEERLGFARVDEGLTDIDQARELFYEELGYDMTDSQFEALKGSVYTRYEEFPVIGARYDVLKQPWGDQPVYRIHGKFASWEQIVEALKELRG